MSSRLLVFADNEGPLGGGWEDGEEGDRGNLVDETIGAQRRRPRPVPSGEMLLQPHLKPHQRVDPPRWMGWMDGCNRKYK